jgi:hypothetical protein
LDQKDHENSDDQQARNSPGRAVGDLNVGNAMRQHHRK